MYGFEGDDDEMTRHRLRQGNLMGPAGFLGLEDNEAIKFVQDGMQHVPGGQHLVKLDPAVAAGPAHRLISGGTNPARYQPLRAEIGPRDIAVSAPLPRYPPPPPTPAGAGGSPVLP